MTTHKLIDRPIEQTNATASNAIETILASVTTRKQAVRRIEQTKERLAKAQAQVDHDTALLAALEHHAATLPAEAGSLTANVGDVVTALVGRGDTKRSVRGTVTAYDESTKRYKVLVNPGAFDAEFFVVYGAQLESVEHAATAVSDAERELA